MRRRPTTLKPASSSDDEGEGEGEEDNDEERESEEYAEYEGRGVRLVVTREVSGDCVGETRVDVIAEPIEGEMSDVRRAAFLNGGRHLVYAGHAIFGKKTVMVIREIDSGRVVRAYDGANAQALHRH